MTLNIITFVACLAMMMLFRRLDRSNMKLTKLRRYSSRVFGDFKKLTEAENRKFNDATIEMDILVKKSNSLSVSLAESLKEIENRLEGLDLEKNNLKKVEDDIKIISHAAKDVNKQIEFIAASRDDFSNMTGQIGFLSENLANIRSELTGQTDHFSNDLRERSRQLSEEFSNTYADSITDLEDKLVETSNILLNNFQKKIDVVAKTVEGATNLNQQIENLKETLSDMENTVFLDISEKKQELNDNIDKIYSKLSHAESNVNSSKEQLIKTFEAEVERIRTELDNLSIHAISKKDEIVQATRKEAEEIKNRIDTFEERYIKLEKRLVDTADEKMDRLDSEYQSVETRFNSLSDKMTIYEEEFDVSVSGQTEKIKKEFSLMDQRLQEIKSEIMGYEEQNRIFSRSEQMEMKVEEAVHRFAVMIQDAQEETKGLEVFIKDASQIKDLKKTVEKEMRAYRSRKDKLSGVENEIKGLMDLAEIVVNRADSLEENISRIDMVNGKLEALSESYSGLDSRIHELQEYEDEISKNLESVNRADIIIKGLDSKLNTFQKIVDRSDKRVEKMGTRLQEVEESTIILKSRESEIQEVKDKFNELDGLSAMLEKRIDQVYAMFNKMESLRSELDDTDIKLKDMFNETDRKMQELADFVQAVDNNNPILKQVKGDINPGKNLNESVIKTVRELSHKGWSADDISRKLMIDENSIRFIINTRSL